jgi:hypothetical protein
MDIPGSDKWKLVEDEDCCWICDNRIFTLFFWSETTGQKAIEKQSEQENFMIN